MSRSLRLVSEDYLDEITDYREEIIQSEPSHGDSGLYPQPDIKAWLEQCERMRQKETVPYPHWVEADQFMLVDDASRRVLGMINFRHYLNDYLAEQGGHIGYGVRPSERQKGYGKEMLRLCLDRCRDFGLDRVLLTCDPSNEASRRTILANGGVFERRSDTDNPVERYWIDLKNS